MTEAPDRVRVLVCDDEPSLRTLLRIALSLESDLEILPDEATDGQEAVAFAERDRPDVILLDLAMPTMDGLEALAELRHVAPESRVVIFSGFQESALGQQTKDLGAVGFVEKGTDPAAVAAAIRRAARV